MGMSANQAMNGSGKARNENGESFHRPVIAVVSAVNRIRLHNDPQCPIVKCLAQISANVVPTAACESGRRGELTGFDNLT